MEASEKDVSNKKTHWTTDKNANLSLLVMHNKIERNSYKGSLNLPK